MFIVLRHADNCTKHVQYHVIPTTALDIYSTAIYKQPHQKITKPCHTNAMWHVTSYTISASIMSIRIRRMSPHRQSSTRQTYSVVVTDRWNNGQIDRNATLCGLYLCSVIRLPQYTIIFSHCPITAVHQHTTERPHCSLLESVNRMRYVTSRLTRLDSDRWVRSHDKLQWRPLVSDRLLCLGVLKLSIHLAGVVDDLSTVSVGIVNCEITHCLC